MADYSSEPEVNDDEKAPLETINKKRKFTLHKKRISDTMQLEFIQLFDTNPIDFRKKTAAMLRENPDLFNMNEIGTVADEQNHVTLEKFQQFLTGLLKPELCKYIYECIDEEYDDHTVTLTAITRFLSGRSRVAGRAKTIIDENWLVRTLKEVDIGTIDETGTNRISLDEFKHYFANLEKEVPEELVIKVFHDIDTNNDGEITTFEYFKWKEKFKAHALHQYLPAKIRKSTTQLKRINTGTKIEHPKVSRKVGFADNENKNNIQNDEIKKLKIQILQLQKENDEKDDIIHDKNAEIDNMKLEKDKYLALNNESTQKNKNLEHKMKQMTAETDGLQQKIEEKKEISDKLQNENAILNEKIRSLEQEVLSHKNMNDSLNKQMSDLQNAKISSNDNIIAMETKINELQALLNESKAKVDENEMLHENINELQTKVKDGNVKIEECELKVKEQMKENENLKQKYEAISMSISNKKEKDENKNDIDEYDSKTMETENENEKLKKLLAENEAELMMMQRDKENLFQQLEETYGIVNDELMLDMNTIKPSKHRKKYKIKTIDDATQLRKQLKKLKSKIDVKDEKIKKYKSQRHLQNNEKKQKKKETEADAMYPFKNLFVFLKDF